MADYPPEARPNLQDASHKTWGTLLQISKSQLSTSIYERRTNATEPNVEDANSSNKLPRSTIRLPLNKEESNMPIPSPSASPPFVNSLTLSVDNNSSSNAPLNSSVTTLSVMSRSKAHQRRKAARLERLEARA